MTLIQSYWCPYKKKKFRHRHAHREKPCADEGRDQGDACTSPDIPKIVSKHQQPGAVWGVGGNVE